MEAGATSHNQGWAEHFDFQSINDTYLPPAFYLSLTLEQILTWDARMHQLDSQNPTDNCTHLVG